MARTTARSDELPAPAGPYSPAARVGGTVMSAGQGGAMSSGHLPGDIADQTRNCLRNVLSALSAAGAAEEDVVKVTVYLTAVEHFAAMNEVYASVFTHPYPARTTVYVDLPPGMLIEADAIAITQETQQ